MEPFSRPSDVAAPLAAVLDDNQDLSVAQVVAFELALANNPADLAARKVYHDWLLEHGCTRRAAQLERDFADDLPEVYTGPVRVPAGHDWTGL